MLSGLSSNFEDEAGSAALLSPAAPTRRSQRDSACEPEERISMAQKILSPQPMSLWAGLANVLSPVQNLPSEERPRRKKKSAPPPRKNHVGPRKVARDQNIPDEGSVTHDEASLAEHTVQEMEASFMLCGVQKDSLVSFLRQQPPWLRSAFKVLLCLELP